MRSVSLATAMTLTGRSKRTLWRFIENGSVIRGDDTVSGKATIDLDSISPYFLMRIDPQDFELIESADAGGGVLRRRMNWPCFFWPTANRPAPSIGWNLPPIKVTRTPCTGLAVAI